MRIDYAKYLTASAIPEAPSMIETFRLHHIRQIRSGQGKTRINIIYMELLGETRNLVTYSVNLVHSLKNFFE